MIAAIDMRGLVLRRLTTFSGIVGVLTGVRANGELIRFFSDVSELRVPRLSVGESLLALAVRWELARVKMDSPRDFLATTRILGNEEGSTTPFRPTPEQRRRR